MAVNIMGEISYADCVLDYFERSDAYDSDFFAVCWNAERGEVVQVKYDTTRFSGSGYAEIDADYASIMGAWGYYKAEATKYFDEHLNTMQAQKISQGDRVVVKRGRKVPKGTSGRVFWTGSKYNQYTRLNEERIGIETDNGERVFVPSCYAEPENWKERLISGSDREYRIGNLAVEMMPYHYRDYFHAQIECNRKSVKS